MDDLEKAGLNNRQFDLSELYGNGKKVGELFPPNWNKTIADVIPKELRENLEGFSQLLAPYSKTLAQVVELHHPKIQALADLSLALHESPFMVAMREASEALHNWSLGISEAIQPHLPEIEKWTRGIEAIQGLSDEELETLWAKHASRTHPISEGEKPITIADIETLLVSKNVNLELKGRENSRRDLKIALLIALIGPNIPSCSQVVHGFKSAVDYAHSERSQPKDELNLPKKLKASLDRVNEEVSDISEYSNETRITKTRERSRLP